MVDSIRPPPEEMQRDSRVGTVLSDRYRLHRLVDAGAMGRVYVGEHVLMRKRVAVKVLHRELTLVPEFVTRFEREAMAAANIDSEHVVAATDFGKLPDGAVFLVLEYVEGKCLRDEIDKGPMPVERVLYIGRQIAQALRSAHALDVVHRDLKPENVMLIDKVGDEDFVKVLDFGIAKVPIDAAGGTPSSDQPITKAGMVFGTPEYMAPEQALSQKVDTRADLYSLGIILYEMLTGVRPFVNDSEVGVLGQQLQNPAPPPSQRAPEVEVPARVEQLVMKLLERDKDKRYQTALEVRDAIDELARQGPSTVGGPTATDEPQPDAGGPAARQEPNPGEAGGARPSRSPSRLVNWVEKHRHRLPKPLSGLPVQALLAIPLSIVAIGIGVTLASALKPAAAPKSAGAPDSSAARPTASGSELALREPSRATEEQLAEATERGPDALEALSELYPEDGKIHIATSALHLERGRHRQAVEALGHALEIEPGLSENKQVASALWVTAQKRSSSAAAFELLEGPMKERGRQIMKDLANTEGVRADVKARARRALAEAEPTK